MQKSKLALTELRQLISAHAMLAKLQKSAYRLLMDMPFPVPEFLKKLLFVQFASFKIKQWLLTPESYYTKKLTDSSLKLSMSLIISSNTGCLHHYVDNTV